MKISHLDCMKCKGRGFCNLSYCPIHSKADSLYRAKELVRGETFSGSSPAPFVGRFGYPHVNVGILSPPEITESAWLYDAPNFWAKENFQIPQIIGYRSSLINSRFKADIKATNKLIDIGREVGMSSKPVDIEFSLERKPSFRLSFEADTAPMGANATLKKAEITSNPKVHVKVEKAVSDTDLKANDALISLYGSGFDENFLSRLLSIGNLGIKHQRKLVPTRWSITATDDAIAKNLMQKIKQNNETEYSAYFGSYLGNYYLVLFFPEMWSFELFETYMPKVSWNVTNRIQYSTDYEPYSGRKKYAENCAGGYYASRLAVLEKLNLLRKQGSCLCLRFITDDYAVPLGVWVVREATRKALEERPIEFSSRELMLKYAESFVMKKFGYDISEILNRSILLKEMKSQTKLANFA